MKQDFALPKFESPQAKRQKMIKLVAIGGASLVLVLSVTVVSVVLSRSAKARAYAERVESDRAAAESVRIAQEQAEKRRADAAEQAANRLAAGEGLPPRDETARAETDEESDADGKSSKRSKHGRSSKGRKTVASGEHTASPDGQKRMKADEIDKLLSQF